MDAMDGASRQAAERELGECVLIVEDIESQRRTVTAILHDEGFQTIACTTGAEAIEHLKQGNVAVAVLDLRLPDMNGEELLRWMQQQGSDVQVVLHTAYSSFESAKSAVNLGAFAYVEKSGDPDELVHYVHRAFEAHLRRRTDALESAVTARTRELRAAYDALQRQIDKQKRAAEEAIRAKRDWEQTFDAVSDLIAIVDRDNRIVRVNRALAERLGTRPERCVGRRCYRLLHGADHPVPHCPHEQLLRDGREHVVEMREEHLDGDFLVGVYPLPDARGTLNGSVHIIRDITERKRAQEAIEASERKYRTVVEAAEEGIGITDLDQNIVFANRTFARMLGYEVNELVGRNLRSMTEKEEFAKFQRETQKRLRGESSRYETVLYTKSGECRHFYLSAAPLHDERGEVIGTVGLLTDITDRKRAEQALRESEERYRSIFEHSPETIVLIDRQGIILEANPRTLEWLECRKEDIVDRHFSEVPFVPAELAAQTRDRFDRRIRGEWLAPYEMEFRSARGKRLVGQVRGAAIRDERGEVLYVLMLISDVTEQKEAQRALHAARDRAQKYLDIAAVMFVALDAAGRITLVNQRACQILGYDERELIGKNWFQACLPEATRDEVYAVFRKLMAGEAAPVEYYENLVRTRDGQERLIAWHNTVLRDGDGTIAGTLSSGEDITDRVRAEQRLRQREAEIAHMGRVHTLGEMAATIAHELNQPLSAISNYVHGVHRRIEKGTIGFEQLSEVLELVAAEVERASGIILHLREFLRKGEPQRTSVSLDSLLGDLMKLVEPDVRRNGIRVELDVDDQIPMMHVDPIQIEQVLLNVVRNAIEAMAETDDRQRKLRIMARLVEPSPDRVAWWGREVAPDGPGARDFGEHAHVADADAEADGFGAPNPLVEIAIADTGKGLDPQDEDRLFDPFFTTKRHGLGMGLAISRSIIEAHGGSIRVARNAPQGTIVSCSIPLTGESGRASDGGPPHGFSGG